MVFVDANISNKPGVPGANNLAQGDEPPGKAARMGEKVLLLIAVLAALSLAVLIAVIDSPVKGFVSGICDHGNCQLGPCMEHLLNLWPR